MTSVLSACSNWFLEVLVSGLVGAPAVGHLLC